MLQGELSAILSTFIKLPNVVKIFVLSIFECPLKTGIRKAAYDGPNKPTHPLSLARPFLFVYSASMKSYQYRIFDSSENISYSSLTTVTFMFLVNDKLVFER